MESLHGGPDTASLLALSDERDQWQALALAREAAAGERRYREGYAQGWADGYAERYAELERGWQSVARPVARGDARSFAELEQCRRGDAA